MRRKSTKIAIAIATAAVIAAGGAALTAGNTVQASVAGYGTSTISGATATEVTYTLNADGTQITAAALIFDGDMTDRTIKAGFDNDATLRACTVDSYDSGTDKSHVSCSGFTQSTATSQNFHVAVTETP
jgi:hypothetical protein